MAAKTRVGDVSLADIVIFAISSSLVVLVAVAFVLAKGSTINGMIASTIIIPQRLVQVFKKPPHIVWPAMVCSLGFLLLARSMTRTADRRNLYLPYLQTIGMLKFLPFALLMAGPLLSSRWQGSSTLIAMATSVKQDRLLNFGPALLWILLIRTDDGIRSARLLRPVLAANALTQVLIVYPIPGSQVDFGTFLMIPVAMICISDLITIVETHWNLQKIFLGAAVVLWAGLTVNLARRTLEDYKLVRSGRRVASSLPGMDLCRIPESQAAIFSWMTANLSAHADRSLCTIGIPSLNIWSGVEPRNCLVIPNNIQVFDQAQLDSLRTSIERYPRFCLIRHLKSLSRADLADEKNGTPIFKWFDEHFVTVGELDGYEFMVRKGRSVPVLLECARAISSPEGDRFGKPHGRRTWAYALDLMPRINATLARIVIVDLVSGDILADTACESLRVYNRNLRGSPILNQGGFLDLTLSQPRQIAIVASETVELDHKRQLGVRIYNRDGSRISTCSRSRGGVGEIKRLCFSAG